MPISFDSFDDGRDLLPAETSRVAENGENAAGEDAGSEFAELRTNGLKVNYLLVCPRKLWLYSKGLRMETVSEQVTLGRLTHEHSYPRLVRREILIDDLIKIDILETEGKLIEIKYSQKLIAAARLQLAYYLYYLRQKGARELSGELRFPRERRKEEVVLTDELVRQVEDALRRVRDIENLPSPPAAEQTSLCRLCAYGELCWG